MGRPRRGNAVRTENGATQIGHGGHTMNQEGKLFLGGVDSHTSPQTIKDYCSKWGEVLEVITMEKRGFGFVTFEEIASAQRFLEVHHHEIDSKLIEAKAAVPKHLGGDTPLTKKMFIGGTGEISDEDLRDYFLKYGEIDEAVVVRAHGVSRGFAFVTFDDEMSVEKCLVQTHILQNGRRVDVKRAIPRDQCPKDTSPDSTASPDSSHEIMAPAPYPTVVTYGYPVYGYGMTGGYAFFQAPSPLLYY